MIGNGGAGLIRFFWVFGVGFDRQWWCGFDQFFYGFPWGCVFPAMMVGLIGGVVLLMADLGQGW